MTELQTNQPIAWRTTTTDGLSTHFTENSRIAEQWSESGFDVTPIFILPTTPSPVPQMTGVELAARFVEKRRDDYVRDHGSYDYDTGFTEFPGDGLEYVGELDEIIEGIRALAAISPRHEHVANDPATPESCFLNKENAFQKNENIDGWQAIGTAPKDGSDLLLSATNWHGDVVVGCWSFEGWRDRDDADALEPTHWMPLPEPPAFAPTTSKGDAS